MARVSVKAAQQRSALQSWEDVDQALRQYGELTLEIEALEAEYTRRINQLREELEAKAGPLVQTRNQLAKEMEQFVRHRWDELDGRSRQLTHGEVGLRRATSIVIRKVADTLAALKERGLHHCINVKETPNKDVMAQLTDEELKAVGARRKIEDVFWFDWNRESVSKSA